ncbi:TIR domain-containing protein [Corallococcus exiguus]|uniref:TIR domain-containing protein n=1 Tax=Corallococcus exiguus TaxID=83462 RepID=UPI003DA5F1C2
MTTLMAARLLVEETAQEQPQAFELACLASFAVRVDSLLLRRLRLELLPGAKPSVEADLWLGRLVAFRGPEGFVFVQGVGAILRERLVARGGERYDEAWRITREAHVGLSPALRLEEELNYLQFSGDANAPVRARWLLRSAVAELFGNEKTSLAHWAAGASARIPSELRELDEGRLLAVAARARLRGDLLPASPPSGAVPEWMAGMATQGLERVQVGVRLFPGFVELGPVAGRAETTIEVPRTEPLVLDMADGGEGEAASPHPRSIFISYVASGGPVPQLAHAIREGLQRTQHQVFPGLEALQFKPGASWRAQIEGWLVQADVFVLLVSESALESRAFADEVSSIEEQLKTRRSEVLFIPVYVLPERASKEPPWERMISLVPARQWLTARPENEQLTIQHLLVLLNEFPLHETRWRRLEFRPQEHLQLPFVSGFLRLRTLQGDEYLIAPAEPAALLLLPPPEDGPMLHEQQADLLGRLIRGGVVFINVTGEPGVGKTQWARQVLARIAHDFPYGCFQIERLPNGPVMSAEVVARRVVEAIAPEQVGSRRDWLSHFHYLLSERRLALVLEDVDTWRWGSSDISEEIAQLRPQGGSGFLMVTSRAPLLIKERFESIRLAPLTPLAAVHLLTEVAPGVGDVAVELAEICHFLATPLREIGAVLARVRSGTRIGLYAALLNRARWLAVFPESFDLRAADVVVLDKTSPPAKEPSEGYWGPLTAQRMLEAGLIRVAGAGRYTLWWPVRLITEPEQEFPDLKKAALRHATYFLEFFTGLTERYKPQGQERAAAIMALDEERLNIDRALRWWIQHGPPDRVPSLLRAPVMQVPWLFRLRWTPREREQLLKPLVESSHTRVYGLEQAFFLLELAVAQSQLGQGKEAVKSCREAFMGVGFKPGSSAGGGVKLVRFLSEQGDWDEAHSLLLRIAEQELAHGEVSAEADYMIARLDRQDGRKDAAAEGFRSARAKAAIEGDIQLEVDALLASASLAEEQHGPRLAAAHYEEALEVARSWRDDRGIALASWGLGQMRAMQGIPEGVRKLLEVLVKYRRSIGHAQAEETAQQMERLLGSLSALRTWKRGGQPRLVTELATDALVASFSPDGGRVVTGNDGNSVELWDAGTGASLVLMTGEPAGGVFAVSFSPNGQRIIAAGLTGWAWLYDVASGKAVGRLHGPLDTVYAASFSPDGMRIITASGDGGVHLWDATSGQHVGEFAGHTEAVFTAGFRPDGQRLVTGGDGGSVLLWEVRSGRNLARLSGHQGRVHAASFSPDGTRIVTAGADGNLNIWNADTGGIVMSSRTTRALTAASFSPDGRHCVVGQEDGTTLIRDLAARELRVGLSSRSGGVTSVGFSPDGGRILTAGGDHVVRIWDVRAALD